MNSEPRACACGPGTGPEVAEVVVGQHPDVGRHHPEQPVVHGPEPVAVEREPRQRDRAARGRRRRPSPRTRGWRRACARRSPRRWAPPGPPSARPPAPARACSRWSARWPAAPAGGRRAPPAAPWPPPGRTPSRPPAGWRTPRCGRSRRRCRRGSRGSSLQRVRLQQVLGAGGAVDQRLEQAELGEDVAPRRPGRQLRQRPPQVGDGAVGGAAVGRRAGGPAQHLDGVLVAADRGEQQVCRDLLVAGAGARGAGARRARAAAPAPPRAGPGTPPRGPADARRPAAARP